MSHRTDDLAPGGAFTRLIRKLRYHEASRQILAVVLMLVFSFHAAPMELSLVLGTPFIVAGTAMRLAASGFIVKNRELATQDAVHPVVIRHPIGGRPSLYVNPGFTRRFDGWTEAESKPLLDYLYAHVTKPEHTCRFRWEPGSVAFWDNRATWHYALNDYHGYRRLMHRITVEGETLEAPPAG